MLSVVQATAYDVFGGVSPLWLAVEKHGPRGPRGLAVACARGQAVSQLPDRRALFDLYVAPDGYVLEKRAF